MLAGDLAEAGVRVTVLERRARESNVTRAFAVHARTMEELQIRGVADELAASGTAIQALRLYGRASIDLERLPSAFHSLLITPQFQTERVLTERLDRLAQVDVAQQPDRAVDRWSLIRPDGYVGWVGTPEQFPSWAERYFRWRASPKPLGARR
jgi:2-polyprenyl-6-methoxyphenol hydroxylase-like FAD-dependent oxidoreductase